MAARFQIGRKVGKKYKRMQIKTGSLLVAHPANADRSIKNHVVLITESSSRSTMGLTLNQSSRYNLVDVMQDQGFSWPLDDTLYTGGYYNSRSLILLHSSDWTSTSTMQVSSDWAISSDTLMLEKLENYNTPNDYRIFVGCTGWQPSELESELRSKTPKWIVMPKPSRRIIMADAEDQWTLALMECSHNAVDSWM
jgi:putative transcriptional regulator